MTEERFRADSPLAVTPCQVCGATDVRLVRVRLADGLLAGWLCDQHARDVEGMK